MNMSTEERIFSQNHNIFKGICRKHGLEGYCHNGYLEVWLTSRRVDDLINNTWCLALDEEVLYDPDPDWDDIEGWVCCASIELTFSFDLTSSN